MQSPPPFSPGASLDDWRKKASFDGLKMRELLQGGEEQMRLKDHFWSEIERDPLFTKPSRVLTMDEMRLVTHKRWKRLVETGLLCDLTAGKSRQVRSADESDRRLRDTGLGTRISLHALLFTTSLTSMGTKKHARIAERARRNEIIGCFSMTELSHGSDTEHIQTTATYEKGELVFNTPHVGAMKVWCGNLALSANYAVVFAQLHVGGKREGVHGFVIQVRDEKTHRTLPGIRIGDMGEKPGAWNAVENGWMVFENYRCSPDALLNKGCELTEDGRYVHSYKSDRDKKSTSLGALSMGRVALIESGVIACRNAATIGIRYSAVRQQFGPPTGEGELPILSYPLQRRRLLPTLAASITMGLFQEKFFDLFTQFIVRMLGGDKSDEMVEMSKEVHGLSSCCKPRPTWLGAAALAEARAACGGHGFLYTSRLNELRDTADPVQTFEGENNILVQQASNYLISQKTLGLLTSPFGSTDFMQTRPSKFSEWRDNSLENVICAYEWLLHYTLQKTESALMEKRLAGVDTFTARNETQIDAAHPLAIAYAESTMIKWAAERVEEIEDANCKDVLRRVVLLFGLSQLQPHLAHLYIGGYCSNSEFGTRVKEEQIKLEESLSSECVALVDAIAPPDFAIASVLGASDGRVYERLVADLQSREIDRCSFTDDLMEIMKKNKAKM